MCEWMILWKCSRYIRAKRSIFEISGEGTGGGGGAEGNQTSNVSNLAKAMAEEERTFLTSSSGVIPAGEKQKEPEQDSEQSQRPTETPAVESSPRGEIPLPRVGSRMDNILSPRGASPRSVRFFPLAPFFFLH